MAGRGPAPKDPDKRRRRNADPIPTVLLEEDDETRGPDLPNVLEQGWPVVTLAWWETWRTSAQAKTFTQTDWDFLLDTALLHARFWHGDAGVAAELRLRVAKFGATPEDRARLRMQVGEPEQKTSESKEERKSRYAHLRIAD